MMEPMNPGRARPSPGPAERAPEASESGRRLRVALFTDNYGPAPSGLLYAVQFLEREVLKAGHRVLLVAPEAKGPNPLAGDPHGADITDGPPAVGARVRDGGARPRLPERLLRLGHRCAPAAAGVRLAGPSTGEAQRWRRMNSLGSAAMARASSGAWGRSAETGLSWWRDARATAAPRRAGGSGERGAECGDAEHRPHGE